jgi:O-antigen/teichoic acid export membrane protein
MSRLALNLGSEIGGRIWVAVIGFAVAPFYMRSLGVEGFALLSFGAALSAVANVFDLGLSTLMNRELARLSSDRTAGSDMRDLVRTFSLVSWLVAALVGCAVFTLAAPLAHRFLTGHDTGPGVVARAIEIIAILAALNLPLNFYWASLLGLQRHAVLNLINVVAVTTAAILNLIGLYLLKPSILTFLVWQAVFLFLKTAAVQLALWRRIGRPFEARMRPELFARHWSFAKGSLAYTILGAILAQADRIVLALILPLREYGFYSIAQTVIQGVSLLIAPFSVASFPRMSELIAAGQDARLRETYHRVCQLLGAVIVPVAATLFFNAHGVLLAWTNNAEVAGSAAPILRAMASASMVNGLLTVPASLILASGRLSLINRFNAIMVFVQVPAMILVSQKFGGLGAALAWLALNLASILILPIVMNRTILKGELRAWWLMDTLPSVLLGTAAPLGLCWLVDFPSNRIAALAVASGMAVTALAVTLLRLGWVRTYIRDLRIALLQGRIGES